MDTKNNQYGLHWVDQITDQILAWQKSHGVKKLHVDDMKTPSGRVHVGSLVGVVLHDVIAKVLQSKTSQPVTSTYVFNDMDPMDGLPSYLDQAIYQSHMGRPLYKIPAPDLDQSGINFSHSSQQEKAKFAHAGSMAEFYALDFINAFRRLGCSQKIIWSHDLHHSGQMDDFIRTALDKVSQLKKIYATVADYKLPDNWYPFQVVCEKCGLVGNTLVTDWDGEQVSYECQQNKVKWSTGCGHQGKISPFGGHGKLLWKVDWPAHWAALGITIEGAGKDHTTAGGSRDMANEICAQVFAIPQPFDIPYEWILVRGAKMSSSKGIGTSAREFVDLFPASIGRFLFVNKHYNQVIDFDPTTMAIPDLFDEYDLAAKIYWGQVEGDNRLARSYELAQIADTPPPAHYLPRFRDVALWMQYPEINLQDKFADLKGSPLNELELNLLAERQEYALRWLKNYAPREFQFTPSEKLPEEVAQLTTDQRQFLGKLAELITSQTNWQPEQLQQAIYDLAKNSLGSKAGFKAIYLAFLGKTSGPKAAWLLLNQDRLFVQQRLSHFT